MYPIHSQPRAVLVALIAVTLMESPASAQTENEEPESPAWAQAENAELESAAGEQIELRADRLELDLESGRACAEGVELWSCGGCESPYSIGARRATLRPSGDIDLVWPVIRVGRVPLLALPWLRVRTTRRWGLLLPRIGLSAGGGFEVGQGVWVPLGPRAALTVEAGYRSEIVGGWLTAEVRGARAWLRAEGQLGREAYSASLQGEASLRRGSLEAGVELDWHLDPALRRALASTVEAEAERFELSRASARAGNEWIAVALQAELLRDLEVTDLTEGLYPMVGVVADVAPPSVGPVSLGLGAATQLLWSSAASARPSWLTVATPRIAFGRALGPLATRVELASLHSAWSSAFDELAPLYGRHALVGAVDVGLPLMKRLEARGQEWVHLLEPTVRYRLTLGDTLGGSGASAASTWSPTMWPLAGHLLWLGLRSLLRDVEGRELRVEVGQLVDLPQLDGRPVDDRLEARIEVAREALRLTMAVAVNEERWALDAARVDATVGSERGHGLRLRWRWLREEATALAGPDPLAALPLLVPWSALRGGHMVGASGWLRLGRTVRLEATAAVDLASQSLLMAGGGLSYRHRCGCLAASVRAAYRPWRRWPDVFLAVDLGGVGRR